MSLKRAAIGVASFLALALPGVASAHGGVTYAPTLTSTAPVIDGTMSSGEWSGASSYPVTLGSIPATVSFEQTATMLYVGVVVNDTLSARPNPSLNVLFDTTHDGVRDQGDDFWLSNGAGAQDYFYSASAGSGLDDTGDGGVDNTITASRSLTAVTFEIAHPLCSSDSAHDICAKPGDTLGIDFQYSPDGIASFLAPGTSLTESGWADITFGVDSTPPAVSVTQPAAGSTLSGTVGVTANATDNVGVTSVHFQYYDGATKTYYDLGTDTAPPWQVNFDTTKVPNSSARLNGTVYATATDAAGNSATSGNGVTVTNAAAAGSLTGTSATPSPVSDISLTAAGTEDWAVWGYAGGGTSTSLAPDVRKSGGTAISSLGYTPASVTTGARAFGSDSQNPLSFDWSDGAPTATAAGAKAGLTAPYAGAGLTFTVPADTTSRTLTVWTSAHFAEGTLTADLSDGSAAAFSMPVHGPTGGTGFPSDNAPTVFTLTYKSATAGQHLTVALNETTNNCGSCDDVVLYAVALAAAAPTGASSSLSTGDASSVGISGSDDSIASIPLRAFDPVQPGVTPAPINGLPINGLPINGLPINGLPINGLPINGLPINGLPINGLPLETPGGWAAALANTTLAGLPLQNVTLAQVLALPNPPPIKLGDLDLSNSALGRETIGSLTLGSTPINGLGLPADSLAALQAWCASVVSTCTASDLGNQSLFALALAGAPINGLPINGLPINGLPINGLPINGLPINGLSLSASPINGLPINGLPINGLPLGNLPINGLPSSVVNCAGGFVCTAATLADAEAAGALAPNATLGDLPDGSLTYGELLQSLLAPGSPVRDTLTIGDVIGMLIQRADVPWETLGPRLLSVFDTSRPTLHFNAHFGFTGSGATPAVLHVTLPPGIDVVPGTSRLTLPGFDASTISDPAVAGNVATWNIPSITLGADTAFSFDVWSGTTVGAAQATLTAEAGGMTTSATAPFTVTDSFEPNDNPNSETLPTITPNNAVQQSAISSRGDVDYYKIAMPAAGTRLEVHLANLPADYDLALYASHTTSVRTTSLAGAPLQDGTVSDQAFNLEGGTNPQLTPTALQDVPNPGLPIVQVSANRGTDNEDVGLVSPGGGGYVLIAVYGYNGASSASPYALRVTTQASTTPVCHARTFDNAGAGTTGTLPTLASMPSDLNTVILVNEKRLGDTYGATAETDVTTALTRLAGDRSLGVSGVVIPVDAVAQAQYDAWDTNPCDPAGANAVANAIADEVAAVKAAHPGLTYVVFAGGDDEIPFFRAPDLSRIANENGFASGFGRNEYFGALSTSNLLTDNPYLDTRPVPASGRQLFIPDLVGGRLVEKPGQIVSAVTRFESSHGTLARSSAFVSGYDFVSDGSDLVRSRLAAFLGTGAVQSLISDSWSKSDLLANAFPTAGPASINSWNGHYDDHEALAANGDRTNLLTTNDLIGPYALSGGIFFTMGCHAGFQATDAIVGSSAPDALDWSEYFAGTGTSFVGNTGFGLGNTDSVAFSEELMAGFAGNLDGSVTVGQALAYAKQAYYLARTSFSAYDEKTLSEAELYGLPMYGVGVAPPAVGAPAAPPPAAADPVRGTSASTSPSAGTLTPLAGTSAHVASFAATPAFSAVQHGDHGSYLTNGGQVQAPNYRPLQPYVSLPATRTGTVAHGVLVDSLTSNDLPSFDPDNVRPTLDLSANEPEPQFADEAWPEKVPTLVTLNDANGLRQSLNLTTGQFFTDTHTHSGVEREWTQVGGRVTYSSSTDFVPPTIDSINAFIAGGAVSFTGRFSDLTETGAPGTVAVAQVVYDVDNSGTWVALPLQQDASTGDWSGGAAFMGANVQFFVEACDLAGNCGFSSNKGRYFDAQPVPAGTGAVQITPDRSPDTGTWYTHGLDVTASAPAGSVTVSVDGGPFTDATGAITLAGDGAHIVDARASNGAETTRVFLIDGRAPTITHTVTPAAPDGANGWYTTKPTVDFTCTDDLSGLASSSCASAGPFGESSSTQHATASATDNAGNTGTDTVDLNVDLSDPAKPTITGIAVGIYGVSSVPPASAIGCNSSDAISGLQSCVITGYGATLGAHTLVATATDKAGRQSTTSLTYVVGYVTGDILPPVTAPSNDQTSPTAGDLQVFKIKSTVPVKFKLYLDTARTTVLTSPPAGSIAKLTFGRYSTSTSSTDTATLISADADSGNVFRWTGATDYQYIYNLSTSGLTAGTYYVTLTLRAADGTVIAQSARQYFILRT